MKKRFIYLMLFCTVCINSILVIQLEAYYGLSGFNTVDHKEFLGRANFISHYNGRIYEYPEGSLNIYPPGYAIVYATLSNIIPIDLFSSNLLLRLIFQFVTILEFFCVGYCINLEAGILSSFFYASSLDLSVNRFSTYGLPVAIQAEITAADLDLVFIMFIIFFLLRKRKNDNLSSNRYFDLILISMVFLSLLLSHISIATAIISLFFISLCIILFIKPFRFLLKSFSLIFVSISIALLFGYLLYYQFILNSSDFFLPVYYWQKVIPKFITPDLLPIIVFIIMIFFIFVSVIFIYLSRLSFFKIKLFKISNLAIIGTTITLFILVFIVIILINTNLNAVMGHDLPGLYYFNKINANGFYKYMGYFSMIFAFMYLASILVGSNSLFKIWKNSTVSLGIIIISSMILFIISILIEFHSARMDNIYIFIPILVSCSILFLYNYFSIISKNKKIFYVFIIFLILLIQIQPITAFLDMQSRDAIYEKSDDYYIPYRLGHSYYDPIITSNLIYYINDNIEEYDSILSSPNVQPDLNAFTKINSIVWSDSLLYTAIINDNFSELIIKYPEIKYILITQNIIRNNEIVLNNKIIPISRFLESKNLDCVYSNSYGELLFKLKK